MALKIMNFRKKHTWLKQRAKDVTSTESAALFGLSPYCTEFELYHRKSTNDLGEIPDNIRMMAGRILEPAIAKMAGEIIGCDVAEIKSYATDDRMGSSFDWQVTSGEYENWILEIKNVDYIVYQSDWTEDEAPDHIEVQVQHQMELLDRPGAIIACLVGGNDLKFIYRKRNKKMGLALRSRIAKFWNDVELRNEPEPDMGKDADFIISQHQSSGNEVYHLEENDPLHMKIANYKRLKSEAKDVEDLAKAVKADILRMIGDNVCKITGGQFTVSCGMTKGTPERVITDAMVGSKLPGRNPYRQFRLTEKKNG